MYYIYLYLDTGFAFAEDVANVQHIMNTVREDNFIDKKFSNKN